MKLRPWGTQDGKFALGIGDGTIRRASEQVYKIESGKIAPVIRRPWFWCGPQQARSSFYVGLRGAWRAGRQCHQYIRRLCETSGGGQSECEYGSSSRRTGRNLLEKIDRGLGLSQV